MTFRCGRFPYNGIEMVNFSTNLEIAKPLTWEIVLLSTSKLNEARKGKTGTLQAEIRVGNKVNRQSLVTYGH